MTSNFKELIHSWLQAAQLHAKAHDLKKPTEPHLLQKAEVRLLRFPKCGCKVLVFRVKMF